MKVYVIEKGVYSDRHVIGVTETEDEAKAVVRGLESSDRYDSGSVSYTEYDTKKLTDRRLKFLVDGNFDWRVEYDEWGLYEDITENTMVYDGYFVIFAGSADVARKIAQDAYAEIKAHRAGVAL